MKDWWQGLSSRERSLLSALAAVVGVLFLYFLIWSPIQDSVSNLRQNVNDNRALVIWMQKATQILQQQSEQSDNSGGQTNPSQRLAVIQTALNDAPFKKHVEQLAQTGQNNVRMVIAAAQFDDLVTWLVTLWKDHGLVANEVSVKRLDNKGKVSANIIISGKGSV